MKKKILFVMESLGIGGAEKSLVTILSLLDYSKYDVDLQLFRYSGEFMNLLPEEVNLLPPDERVSIFADNFKSYILKGKLSCAYHSLMWLIKCALTRLIKKQEYVGWNHLKHLYNDNSKKYDTAIGFMEKKSIYYCVDKTHADRKIGFIHTDYKKIEHDKTTDMNYFSRLDAVVAVSDHAADVLKNEFLDEQKKVFVIKNMVSTELIKTMSKEDAGLKKQLGVIDICTVGRLIYAKGIDIAAETCNELVKKGYKVRWFICGDGSERHTLEKMIKEYGLEKNFILLGAQTNPYKYMEFCDIYVQPSRYEGYGITIAEAKALCKPIVASDIPEFREQIEDGVNGCIYKANCADAIIYLIKHDDIRNTFIENLKSNSVTNRMTELEKLEGLL